jgi:dolichyl-phosphate-mannose--protein O-mannosyl transferase
MMCAQHHYICGFPQAITIIGIVIAVITMRAHAQSILCRIAGTTKSMCLAIVIVMTMITIVGFTEIGIMIAAGMVENTKAANINMAKAIKIS